MITFLFTIDVDQDGLTADNQRDALSWSAVDAVRPLAAALRARGGRPTWFVRADNQLADVYGSAAYLHDHFHDLWSELREAGDDFAWHPHLYTREADGRYHPERDDARCAVLLREIHAQLAHFRFRAVRIGELRHGNRLMQTLNDLGLAADCTALPGRVRNDAERVFDWGPTPAQPFHPSCEDYRVPGDDPLAILELPLAVVDIQADYDPRPLPRYLNLAYRPQLLRDAWERWLRSYEVAELRSSIVQTIIHPEEVLGARPHGLYAYSLDAVKENIDFLVDTATRRGIDARMMTVGEAVASIQGNQSRLPS